jgi:hypothetical protein
VAWQPPDSVGGASAVTGYVVKVTPGGHSRTLAATARTASFTVPAGSYAVAVSATSAAGTGLPATAAVHVAGMSG